MPISSTKPTGDIRWATNALTRIEPNSGHKDTGWVGGEIPTAHAMNWLQGVIYDWQQYFEDATDQLDSTKLDLTNGGTVAGATIFSSTVTLTKSTTGAWAADGGQLKLHNTSNTTGISGARAGISFLIGTSQPDGMELDVYRSAEDVPVFRLISNVDASGTAIWTATPSLITIGIDVAFSGDVTTNFNPSVTGQDLGSNSKRWDCNFNNVDIDGDVNINGIVSTALIPQSSGLDLGSSGARWDLFGAGVNLSGDITLSGSSAITGGLSANFIGTVQMATIQAHTGSSIAVASDLIGARDYYCTNENFGFVLIDRTDNLPYRIKLVSGVLSVEAYP